MAEFALPALMLERVDVAAPAGRVLVANRVPEPLGQGVHRDTAVSLDVLALEGSPIAAHECTVRVQGRLAFDGLIHAPFAGPRSAVEGVTGGTRITLDPLVPFLSEERVAVHVVVALEDGATWDDTYAFVIEDRTPPRLLAAEAVSGTQVVLSFSEPVDALDIQATFEALNTPAVPLELVSAYAEGSLLHLSVTPVMTPAVRYRVTVQGVIDANGNAAPPPDHASAFVGFRPPQPATRRFDLWSMLPRYNRREDATGDLRKLIACFQEALDLVLSEIDRFTDIVDVERAPEQFVDAMLAEVGNPFAFVLNDIDKRKLATSLVELYLLKGTEQGIRNAARFLLGIELGAITTYAGSPLVLGESVLGVDWELGPSSRFALYAFEVHVPVPLADEQRQRLRALILWAKPAHTHLIDILEPPVVVERDEWVLGESELAILTVLV